LITNP